MADNTVNIGINVSDNNSTNKVTNNVKDLKDLLDKTAAAAARVNVGGSRVGAAAAGVGGTPSSRVMAAPQGAEGSMYAASRGAAGGTGSAASDFAGESRGLGGLVRVYATFAANIYAVTAAFKSLSEAVNTAHMVQGLEQLGAASGKNLVDLSKQLGKVTDGALSMKQSMEAVAQMSAAQMSSANILKLGVVAKMASQALGRDMTDSVNRLSLGISKMQPKLLDELGILVNVNTVTTEYARTIGKTASTLTDFEKRQAFANATLTQGIKKFGAIDIPTNPYTKLESSLANLAQTGLSLINTVLGPLVELLSKSPTALTSIFAAIGLMLLKQSIPALTNWRASLTAAAKTAADTAATIRSSYDSMDVSAKVAKGMKAAEDAATKAAGHIANVQNTLARVAPTSNAFKATMVEGPGLDPVKNQDRIDSLAQASATKLSKLEKERLDTVKYAGATELDIIDKKIAKEAERQKALQRAALENKAAATELQIQAETLNTIEQTAAKPTLRSRILGAKASAAETKATKLGIYASIPGNVETMGTKASFGRLFDEIKNGKGTFDELGNRIETSGKGLKGLSALTTAASGTFRILGSSIMAVTDVLMPYLILLPLIAGAWSFFDSEMSTAKKQQEAFDDATQSSDSSLKAVANTLAYLGKNVKTAFSLSSIQATTNALDGVVLSLEDQVKAYKDLTQAQSTYEKIWDRLWTKLGKGNINTLIDSISKDIPAALDTMLTSIDKDKVSAQLAQILKLDPKDLKTTTIKETLTSLFSVDPRAATDAIGALTTSLSKANETNKKSTGALTDFHSALDEVGKVADELHNKLEFTDVFGKMGVKLVGEANTLATALKDPIKGIEALNTLLQDQKTLSLIPKDSYDKLIATSARVKELNTAMAENTANLLNAQKAVAAQQEKEAPGTFRKFITPQVRLDEEANTRKLAPSAEMTAALSRQGDAQKLFDSVKRTLIAEKTVADDAVKAIYKAGMEYLGISLKLAMEEAAVASARSYLSVTAAAGGRTADREYALSLTELDIQKRILDASYNSQLRMMENTEAVEKSTAVQTITLNQAKLTAAKEFKPTAEQPVNPYTPDLISKYTEAMTAAQKTVTILENAKALREGKVTAAPEAGAGRGTGKYDTSTLGGTALTGTALTEAQLQNTKYDQIKMERDAGMAKIKAAADQKAVTHTLNKITEEERIAQETKDTAIKENTVRLALIKLLEDSSTIYNQSLANERTKLELDNLRLAHEKEQVAFDKQQALISAMPAKDSKEAFRLQERLTAAKSTETTGYSIAQKAVQVGANTKSFEASQKESARLAEYSLKLEQDRNSVSIARLNNENLILSNKAALGRLDEETYAKLKATNELEQLALTYKVQQMPISAALVALEAEKTKNTAEDKLLEESMVLLTDLQLTALNGLRTARDKQLADKITLAKSTFDSNEALNESQKTSIQLAKEQNIELAKRSKILEDQKYAMDNLVSVTTSLATVFGDVGKNFGDGLLTILKATQDANLQRTALDDKYAASKLKIETDTQAEIKSLYETFAPAEDIAAATDSGNKKKLDNEKKYIKDSGNLEFDKNAKVISSTKKMFSEKTAAYKILDAVEKSQHIVKLGLEAKEVAMSLWAEGKKLWAKLFTAEAGTAAATIAATEEIALDETTSAMSVTAATPGIFAKFTEQMGWYGWAAAAAVVAALGGMAMSGGGSGPPAGFTAAEQQKVQGTGQEYKNGALVDRAGGVLGDSKATAKSIVDSIDILGKVFFDVLGSGSSDMMQYLKGIQEATQQTAKALIGSGLFGEGATKSSSSSSALGFSKSSTTVEDAGIKVTGTLDNIATGLGKIAGYENITQKSSSFWGLSSSSNSFTNDVKISDAVKKNISNIFVNVKGALVAAGTALEGSGMRVADLINQIPIELKVSSLGLTASEFADKLLAEISVKLNAAAEQAFPYISKYVKVGEEMYSTVARIVKEGETLNTGLDMIGKSITGVDTLQTSFWGLFRNGSSAAEDAVTKQQTLLSKFAGGIDEFTTSVQFYFDNFKTATQKSTFYTSTLTKGFKDMGISAIPTADEFNKMVDSLDVTTEAGAGVFASLMKLAPGMDRYNKELETTAALNVTLMETQGNAAGALAAKRALEYKAMTTVDAGIQRHIYALQDQAKAQTAVESALNNTITSIRGSIDNLTNYQTSLTMGAQSTLTSEQKYNKAKQTLIDTAAAAQGPTDTPEQLKIQAAAASKLQSASTDFLTASGVMFNSTEQYATDLASVQNLVGDTITSLGATESIAETQLDQIKKSTGYLSSIDANTQSTLDLFNQYFAAVDVSKAAAATPFTVDAVSPITANQLTQNALLIEQNRLTQAQIDATNAAAAATITSNAAVVAKQTELLQAMAEQAARDAAYYNNSQVQSDHNG